MKVEWDECAVKAWSFGIGLGDAIALSLQQMLYRISLTVMYVEARTITIISLSFVFDFLYIPFNLFNLIDSIVKLREMHKT